MNREFILLIIVMLIFGCDQELEPNTNPLEDTFITGTWEYSSIKIQGERFIWATDRLEPKSVKDNAGGDRGEILRRYITYNDDHTYQLRWMDRGDYQLGTEGDPNWQPNFGYWNIIGNQLIHNMGLGYETSYSLSLGTNSFSRTHLRYMSEEPDNHIWQQHDSVEFTESFVPKED